MFVWKMHRWGLTFSEDLILILVCVYTHVSCVDACAYMITCVWRPEINIRCFQQSPSTFYLFFFYFTQGLSLNLELTEPFPMNARTDLRSLCLCCKHLILDLRTFILFIQTMPDPLSLERLSDPWTLGTLSNPHLLTVAQEP